MATPANSGFRWLRICMRVGIVGFVFAFISEFGFGKSVVDDTKALAFSAHKALSYPSEGQAQGTHISQMHNVEGERSKERVVSELRSGIEFLKVVEANTSRNHSLTAIENRQVSETHSGTQSIKVEENLKRVPVAPDLQVGEAHSGTQPIKVEENLKRVPVAPDSQVGEAHSGRQSIKVEENLKRVPVAPDECDDLGRLDIKVRVHRSGGLLLHDSCDKVCELSGWKCYVPAMKSIGSDARIRDAVLMAGWRCSKVSAWEIGHSNWDGPWVNSVGECGFGHGASFMPNCNVQPPPGHARVCTCITGEAWKSEFCSRPLASTTTGTTTTTTFYDVSLGRLQEYYRTTGKVSQFSAEWIARQRLKYATKLNEYNQLLHGEKTSDAKGAKIRWIIAQKCSGSFVRSNCDQLCEAVGGTCSLTAMTTLTSKAAVSEAASAAGQECSSFSQFSVGHDYWDGPWISAGGECGYVHGDKQGWRPNCHVQPPKALNLGRICACEAASLPSPWGNCREAKKIWHQQWYHDCGKATAPRPGPITHHFHFVELGPRSVFVDPNLPISLISSDHEDYQGLGQEDHLLIDNIYYTLGINNATSAHFHDEFSCTLALAKIDTRLVGLFNREGDLRFKSDICRSAALYLEGGIYNDDDQINYRPIVPWLKNTTNFASAQSDHSLEAFSNSFMAATPCHPILRQHLDLILSVKARANRPTKEDPFRVQVLLGPETLAETYARYYHLKRNRKFHSSVDNRTQLLRETRVAKLRTVVPGRNGHICEFGFYDPEHHNAMHACSRP